MADESLNLFIGAVDRLSESFREVSGAVAAASEAFAAFGESVAAVGNAAVQQMIGATFWSGSFAASPSSSPITTPISSTNFRFLTTQAWNGGVDFGLVRGALHEDVESQSCDPVSESLIRGTPRDPYVRRKYSKKYGHERIFGEGIIGDTFALQPPCGAGSRVKKKGLQSQDSPRFSSRHLREQIIQIRRACKHGGFS